MNLIDKAVAVVSPQKGLRRMAARKQMEIMNTGYSNSGANKAKKSMRGWFFKGGSVKEDIEDNLDTLVQRARDLYMNTPLATGALKTIRTNAIGSGLVLNSQIDYEFLGLSEEEADAWETQVEREFGLWANG